MHRARNRLRARFGRSSQGPPPAGLLVAQAQIETRHQPSQGKVRAGDILRHVLGRNLRIQRRCRLPSPKSGCIPDPGAAGTEEFPTTTGQH